MSISRVIAKNKDTIETQSTEGTIQDRLYKLLLTMGYKGTLNDMLFQHYRKTTGRNDLTLSEFIEQYEL